MVKNLPAIWETCVRFLGGEYPLEEGNATHSSILAWRIPWRDEPGGLHTVHGVAKSGTRLSTCMGTPPSRERCEMHCNDVYHPALSADLLCS